MRLLSRSAFVPGGFAFFQPETNWHAPSGSFNAVAEAIRRHRLGNPHLVKKHGWATDSESIADELDSYVALNLSKNPRYSHFITEGGGSVAALPKWRPRSAVPVEAAKKTVAGIRTLLDFFGSGGRPVEKALAEKRGAICQTCPHNKAGDWSSWFTGPVADVIRQQLGIKNDLRLVTSRDADLHVCELCRCDLKLKPWVPLHHILEYTSPEVMASFPAYCWIKVENEIPR